MSRTAIVFDLDGTLVDTAPDLHAALNHALHRAGRPSVRLGDVRNMVGDGVRKLLERGFVATGGMPHADVFEDAAAACFAWYGENLSRLSRPFPEAADMLETLREQGFRLGICTNKPHRFAVRLLDELGLLDRFAAVLGGDSLPVRKPDAGHLLGTIAAMGSQAGEAAMVGDSVNDVLAARNAGVPVVVVGFGYTAVPAEALGADRVIDRFSDLPQALAGL